MKNSRFFGSNRISGISGKAGIEAIATLLLLLLIGICIFSLSITSTSAYKRLYDSKDYSSRARIAMSFINMKIRQNDVLGGIEIRANPINGKNALVLSESYEGEDYENWIFWDGGRLKEAIILAGEAPSNAVSLEIAELDGFEIESVQQNSIHTRVWAGSGDRLFELESLVSLRTGKYITGE